MSISSEHAASARACTVPEPRERLSIAPAAEVRTADALARVLADLGVTTAFGIMGGAVAPLADAFARSSDIRVVHTRHESGAAFAATEASLTADRPAVVFTTTGPGITNALTGLFVAREEGARVILVSGATPAAQRERWPLQDSAPGSLLDGVHSAGPLFHYATTIEHPAQLQAAAVRLARGVRRNDGFVAHVAVPSDVQSRGVMPPRSLGPEALRPERIVDAHDVARCVELLASGSVMLWLGHGARHCASEVRALAERLRAPVMTTPGGKGIFPERHRLYVGVTGIGGHDEPVRAVQELRPDHIVVLGTRLDEMSWGWDERLLPRRSFIHVDADPDVPARAHPDTPTLAIRAHLGAFLEAVLQALPEPRGDARATSHTLPPPVAMAPRRLGRVRPQVLLDAVQRVIVDGSDAIVLADAGNSFVWTHQRLRFRQPGRFRSNTAWACMGHGAAGVLGAAMHHHAKAVAIVGDGAMLMNCEIGTAVQYGIPVVWVVVNDSLYGMVDHGMRGLGLPPVETAIPRTDFAQIARAMGADGVRVACERDLEAALGQAMRAPGPFVVDVVVDPEVVPPLGTRCDNLRAQGKG